LLKAKRLVTNKAFHWTKKEQKLDGADREALQEAPRTGKKTNKATTTTHKARRSHTKMSEKRHLKFFVRDSVWPVSFKTAARKNVPAAALFWEYIR
jgi:hypothetical protein